MKSKHIFVETCQLILVLQLTNTEVLSEKVANFKSLGYMPDQVALELRQMQNGYSAPRYVQANNGAYANPFPKIESAEKPIKEVRPRAEKRKKNRHTGKEQEVETDEDAKKRFAVKDVVIDFDELVDKVKDRLKDEFYQKKKASDKQKARAGGHKDLRNNPVMDTDKTDISLSLKNIHKSNVNQEKANEPREAWKQFMTTNSPKNVVVTPDIQPSHKRGPMKRMKKNVHANDELFEVADLTKVKDSYEDYITPKRGKMYASDTEDESENPLPKNEGEPKENYNGHEEYKNIPKAADLLKAGRSSDKLRKIKKLDDPISFVQEEYDPSVTEKFVDRPEKAMFVKLGGNSDGEPAKLKGTMIPTRHFFKMSSPNYYGKLPAVAEKYDFNEPLPDKDREPENMKYFINPPARINKKVKLEPFSEVVQEN